MYQVRGIIADPLGRVAFLVNFKFWLGFVVCLAAFAQRH